MNEHQSEEPSCLGILSAEIVTSGNNEDKMVEMTLFPTYISVINPYAVGIGNHEPRPRTTNLAKTFHGCLETEIHDI